MIRQRIESMRGSRTTKALETAIVAITLTLGGVIGLLPHPAEAAELVMFESRSCVICQRFHREIGPDYQSSPGAKVFPLRRVDIDTDKIRVKLERPVTMTPTFVFVDKGAEMARFVGYPGREPFFRLTDGIAETFREMQAEANGDCKTC